MFALTVGGCPWWEGKLSGSGRGICPRGKMSYTVCFRFRRRAVRSDTVHESGGEASQTDAGDGY